MPKEMIFHTRMYSMILAFLKRKGINPNDVRSADFKNVGGGPGIVTIELFYDELDVPAPEPSTLGIDRVGEVRITDDQLRITDEAIRAADEAYGEAPGTSDDQMRAALRAAAQHWGFEVIE